MMPGDDNGGVFIGFPDPNGDLTDLQPVIVTADRAFIGRPTDRVTEFFAQ